MRSSQSTSQSTGPRRRGVTIVEVAIVLFVLATAALVALPYWSSRRIVFNEDGAVEVLAGIAAAQEAFRVRSGGQTYAFLSELLGESVRRGGIDVDPPLLPGRGLRLLRVGCAAADGYHVAVYLRGASGDLIYRPGPLDPAAQGKFWMAMAWPTTYGTSGRAIFAIDATGTIMSTTDVDGTYSGPSAVPPGDLYRPAEAPASPRPLWMERVRWAPVAPR